ncbi:hypothetical protein D3C87_1435020 [compost metagenome]
MNSNIFTKSVIDQIVERFANLRCSYEFDEMYNSHYVEIEPKLEFEQNEELNEFLDNIYFDFISKYPCESLAFSTNSGKTELENVYYEAVGFNFDENKTASWILTKFQSKFIINNNSDFEEEYFLEDMYASAA